MKLKIDCCGGRTSHNSQKASDVQHEFNAWSNSALLANAARIRDVVNHEPLDAFT
jgi:hypothetical protein